MANLTFISPFFIVSSLKDSVDFYVNKLGFELRYTGPENDPFFAIVGRDHISIMLRQVENPPPTIPVMIGPDGMHIFPLQNRTACLRNIVPVESSSVNPSRMMTMGCVGLS